MLSCLSTSLVIRSRRRERVEERLGEALNPKTTLCVKEGRPLVVLSSLFLLAHADLHDCSGLLSFSLNSSCPVLHHTTPHHTTPHRTAPHRTAPHRTAPHRTAPHRTAPHHTTPHHTTPHQTNCNSEPQDSCATSYLRYEGSESFSSNFCLLVKIYRCVRIKDQLITAQP